MSEKQLILTIDQGTTSSRAILFDRFRGDADRRAAPDHPVFSRRWLGRSRRHEIWQTVRGCVFEALVRAGARLDDVAAIGITNQRETTIVWDRQTGEPLAPAIVWQSRQSAPM